MNSKLASLGKAAFYNYKWSVRDNDVLHGCHEYKLRLNVG